ncbi:MAG: hypothetical protein LBQ89_08045 [Treponema sp.]|jgi:hypothetical protein|nr:hypothetical protein [Treponema sp.]
MSNKAKMTAQEAKELSLEVWRYLAEHPEIGIKEGLPKYLWDKIKDLLFQCPLCAIENINCFSTKGQITCPLLGCSDYHCWLEAHTKETRKDAAKKIVVAIEAWEPKE